MTKIINKKYSLEWNEQIKHLAKALGLAKQTQLDTLLTEINTVNSEKEAINTQIQAKSTQIKYLRAKLAHKQGVQKEKGRISTQNPEIYNNFRGTKDNGTSADHPYRGKGWEQLNSDYYSSLSSKDNLYTLKFEGAEIKITEEQVIKTLSRIITELGKLEAVDFESKCGITDLTKKTALVNILKNLNTISAEIELKNKDLSVKSYDFVNLTNKLNLTETFEFLLELTEDLANNLKSDSITKTESWKIAKSGDAYSAEELANHGIILSSDFTLYKSSKLEGGMNFTDSVEFKVENGLLDWLKLAEALFKEEANRNKLIASFTNSPTENLLADLKTIRSDGIFIHNTHHYRFFESEIQLEELIAELEVQQSLDASQANTFLSELKELQQNFLTKRTAVADKKKVLNPLVGEILTKKREELKAFEISKGFSGDQRKSVWELIQISFLLEHIRYLENDGDSNKTSTIGEENTAYTEIGTLLTKVNTDSNLMLVRIFKDLAFKGKVGENYQLDTQQAIGKVKSKEVCWSLDAFLTDFSNKEKLVKLDAWESEAKTALEKELGQNPTPPSELINWQTKLKALDANLDAKIITEAWKAQWKTVNNFKTITEVETLLKKVIVENKIKPEFLTYLQTKEATLVDLKTLLLKTPTEVITFITRFEFDNLSDAGEDKTKEKTQKTRKIKKALQKSATDTLTEAEIEDTLLKVATGEITLNTNALKEDLSEYSSEQPRPSEETKPSHFAKYWWAYGLVGLTVVGALAYIYWEQIMQWWNCEDKEEKDESPWGKHSK